MGHFGTLTKFTPCVPIKPRMTIFDLREILVTIGWQCGPCQNEGDVLGFLDASTHLYKRLCPSIGWSVGLLVRLSVTTFFKQ